MSSSETEPQTEPKPLPDRARDWLFRLIYAWRVGGEEPQRVGSDVTERFVLISHHRLFKPGVVNPQLVTISHHRLFKRDSIVPPKPAWPRKPQFAIALGYGLKFFGPNRLMKRSVQGLYL